MGTDGFCPFKDNLLLSLWPIIIILMNLADTARYDPRNIIIMYVATSIDGGQPKNFNAHLEHVARELLAGANGFQVHVGDVPTTVHVVAPIVSCDGPGAQARAHACRVCVSVARDCYVRVELVLPFTHIYLYLLIFNLYLPHIYLATGIRALAHRVMPCPRSPATAGSKTRPREQIHIPYHTLSSAVLARECVMRSPGQVLEPGVGKCQGWLLRLRGSH